MKCQCECHKAPQFKENCKTTCLMARYGKEPIENNKDERVCFTNINK